MKYDVAIIGAGPAGATLARILSYNIPDINILLIDAQTEERPKVCGGLLSECAQKLLAKFDIALPTEVLVDPQIFAVDVIDLDSKNQRRYQKHYFNMDRYKFDKWLLSLIPERVTVVSGRCTAIKGVAPLINLTVNKDTGCDNYEAGIVVGADGAASFVRKFVTDKSVYKYTSIQQWFKRDDSEGLPRYTCIYDRKTSDSCSWTIRKGEYFIYGGAFKTKLCRDSFEKQKARLESYLGCDFGSAERTEACLVCSPRRRADFAYGKDGIFLIGEAAGFISANSYEGISNAMMSAKNLSDALKEENLDPARTLKRYKKKSRPLMRKMKRRILETKVLSSHFLRNLILKSKIKSIEKFV